MCISFLCFFSEVLDYSFSSVINSAALNTNVHVGIELLSKSCLWLRKIFHSFMVLHRERYDCRISLTILLGACILLPLTYTCLSRIQVVQSTGHIPGLDLCCWVCNKNC